MPPSKQPGAPLARAKPSLAGGLLLIATCLFVLPAHGESPGVLGPSATEPIRSAFERLRPALQYESIHIERDHVTARVCATDSNKVCWTLQLQAPSASCATGAFCILFPEGTPPDQIRSQVESAFRSVTFGEVWSTATPKGSDTGVEQRTSEVWWVAALVLVLPLVLGGLIGGLLRLWIRRRVRGRALAMVMLVAPATVSTVATLFVVSLGVWDGLTVGLLIGLGLLLALHSGFQNTKALVFSSVMLMGGLFLMELGARALLPKPPAFPSSPPSLQPPRIAMASAQDALEAACVLAYGARYPHPFPPRLSEVVFPSARPLRPGANRRVLHLGDSMVYGQQVPRDQTFVAALERLDPSAEQIDGGIPGAAPDEYFVALNGWLREAPINGVVIYLFEGNDLYDLDAAHPCSGGEALLRYENGRVALRQENPTNTKPSLWATRSKDSPLPFLLRALIFGGSSAAAHLGAFLALPVADARSAAVRTEKLSHLKQILETVRDECRERQLPLVVVVLPDRNYVEGGADGPVRMALLDLLGQLGVQHLDAGEPVYAAVRSGEHVFLPEAGDVHFSIEGHALIARWLAPQLATMLSPGAEERQARP